MASKSYVGELKEKIIAKIGELREKISKLWSKSRDFVLEHKNPIVGVILVSAVALAIFYTQNPVEIKPDITKESQESKILPFIAQNKDLVILIEYEWIDTVYRNDWECKKVTSAPQVRLRYNVKNNGERFDELLYLPVPDYIYPNQFSTKPKFSWINGLYVTIRDQPLEKGAIETYEFIVGLEAYKELCNLKNELDGYSYEVETRYEELKTGLPASRQNQISEAYISFKLNKESVDWIVENVRAGGPELALASLDQMNKFNIKENAILAQGVIASEYSLMKTENRISSMEEALPESKINQILDEIGTLKEKLDEEMNKPSLEDLLDAYYNTPR